MLIFEIDPTASRFGKFAADFFRTRKGIKNPHLLFAGEKTLVIMRPVEIDQGNSQIAQKGEGARRTVYELLSPPLGKNRALDDEGSVFAGFGSSGFENGMEWRSGIDLEEPFHRAGCGSAANEGSVCSFPEEKFHSAEDDGFSRSSFSSDGDKTCGGFPKQILDQCEVADA